MKHIALLGLAVLAACAVPAMANVTLSDFDTGTYYGGTYGWFPYGAIAMGTVTAPTGSGADNTNWAWLEPGQYYGHFTAQNWAFGDGDLTAASFNANTDLTFDVIFPGSGPNEWFPSGPTTITFDIQTTGGVLGTVDSTVSATVDSSVKDSAISVDIPYSSVLPLDPTSTGMNLTLEVSPGYDYNWDTANPNAIPYAAYMYIDNIALVSVPEPASLTTVLALGTLGLIRRRRA